VAADDLGMVPAANAQNAQHGHRPVSDRCDGSAADFSLRNGPGHAAAGLIGRDAHARRPRLPARGAGLSPTIPASLTSELTFREGWLRATRLASARLPSSSGT
jgi:hypothetical protein